MIVDISNEYAITVIFVLFINLYWILEKNYGWAVGYSEVDISTTEAFYPAFYKCDAAIVYKNDVKS